MPSDESKGSQLDAIGSLAQRQLDNTVRTAEPYAGERNGNSSARADLVAGRTGRGDGAEQVYCHGVHGSAHHHHVGSQSGPMELGCDRLRR